MRARGTGRVAMRARGTGRVAMRAWRERSKITLNMRAAADGS